LASVIAISPNIKLKLKFFCSHVCEHQSASVNLTPNFKELE
jgi:hypothetical protein